MRRADRLFQIVQHLRKGRLVTAAELARCLEVSERTVYRDMRDLAASGVPVEGEAGVGYLLRDGYDLPPLMFTRDEVEALVVGARLARACGVERALVPEDGDILRIAREGTRVIGRIEPKRLANTGRELIPWIPPVAVTVDAEEERVAA